MKQVILVLVMFMSFVIYSHAQTATPNVTKKQKNQTERIKEGVESGELTRGETAALKKDKRELRRMKKAAKADGVVTPEERARLNKKANRNSKKIYRKKNN